MSFASEAMARGEDWPGTYDLCRGPGGWSLDHHTCSNPTCWCENDPPEMRCGYTAEKARVELVSMLRHVGDHVVADRVEKLTAEELLAEHFGDG